MHQPPSMADELDTAARISPGLVAYRRRRPIRLRLRAELDEAVCAAYGFPPGTWKDRGQTLRRLMQLNQDVAR